MNKLFKYPVVIILIILSITVFFALQLKNIQFDNDITHFTPDDNPANLMKDKVSSQFGNNSKMVLGLESKKGTVFEADNLMQIYTICRKFEENPIFSEVMSIVTVELVLGNKGGMSVEKIVPDTFTGTESEIIKIKSRLMSWDKYLDGLVSDDFMATQIVLTAENLDDSEEDLLYEEINRIVEESDLSRFNTYVAGSPAVKSLLSKNMKKDMALLVPIVVLLIALILLIMFRRISGVILPLLTVLLSTIWTLGLMALLKVPLSMIATIIPVLMIAVGSAYGIHIITHYYEDMQKQNKKLTKHEYSEIIFNCLRKVGPAVILAGVTTIAGFGSLSISQVKPMQSFGIFSAVGVLAALLVSLLFIPSLLLIRQPLNKKIKGAGKLNNIEFAIHNVYLNIISKKALVIFGIVLILIVSVFGSSLIITDNNLVKYFKKTTDIVKADSFLNKNFNGINTMAVVIEGTRKGELLDPDLLQNVVNLGIFLKQKHPEQVGDVFSFADLLMRMNKVMHWDAESPYKPQIVANETGQMKSVSNNLLQEDNHSDSPGQESDEWGFSDFSSFESFDSIAEDIIVTEGIESETSQSEIAISMDMMNEAYLFRNSKNISAQELLDLMNVYSNYQGEAYNEIPLDFEKYGLENKDELKELISQYLILYSGNTDSMIDDSLEPQKMKITIQLKSNGSLGSSRVRESILQYVNEYFPDDKNITVSGIAVIQQEVTRLITQTQTTSILISIALVFLIILIYFRSFTAGLIGIFPLAIAIMINFAIMGFCGIRLDISTAMLASIAIGIGIDYTIHFLSTYRQEHRNSSDENTVCRNTIRTTGKAIIFNAVSVGLGFAVLLFSQFNPLVILGALIMVTMGTSSLSAIIVLPVLLKIFKPAFITGKNKQRNLDKEKLL